MTETYREPSPTPEPPDPGSFTCRDGWWTAKGVVWKAKGEYHARVRWTRRRWWFFGPEIEKSAALVSPSSVYWSDLRGYNFEGLCVLNELRAASRRIEREKKT
jgi:hypothetical protein